MLILKKRGIRAKDIGISEKDLKIKKNNNVKNHSENFFWSLLMLLPDLKNESWRFDLFLSSQRN